MRPEILAASFILVASVDASYFASLCSEDDEHAPCACKVIITNMFVRQQGKMINVEFPEAVCAIEENRVREANGKIPAQYSCTQMKSQQTLFRDANDDPIKLSVRYRTGCELRCTSIRCLKERCHGPLQIWDDKNNICVRGRRRKFVVDA